MTETHTEGNSGDYAYMYINHEKKKIRLINSETGKSFKKNTKSFDFSWIFLYGAAFTLILPSIIFVIAFDNFYLVSLSLVPFYVFFISYYFYMLNPEHRKKVHQIEQHIFSDLLRDKKFIKIKKINSLTFQFPYYFEGTMFNYKIKGDFKRFLKKVKIRHKRFYVKKKFTGKKTMIKDREWGVWFYFKEIPKNGWLEVTWI